MVYYRRHRVPGGTYFFTVTLRDRSSAILVDHIQSLRSAVGAVIVKYPFIIDAWVVLPEHLHAVWRLPQGDDDFTQRWRAIKSTFTRLVLQSGVSLCRNNKAEYDLWQRRFWEHAIRDEKDYENHVNYIHYNPVKHGVVKQVCEWPYSTFHRFVRNRVYSNDWGGPGVEERGNFGE